MPTSSQWWELLSRSPTYSGLEYCSLFLFMLCAIVTVRILCVNDTLSTVLVNLIY